jgi:hypothetical protein
MANLRDAPIRPWRNFKEIQDARTNQQVTHLASSSRSRAVRRKSDQDLRADCNDIGRDTEIRHRHGRHPDPEPTVQRSDRTLLKILNSSRFNSIKFHIVQLSNGAVSEKW